MNLCFDTGYAALAGGAGGGMPTGAAGGDLSGTYPNPTVRASSTTFALRSPIAATVDGNKDNWAPTGLGTCNTIKMQTDGLGPWNITGIDISAFIPGASTGTNTDNEGVILILQNDSSLGGASGATIVLKAANGGSSAANQFGFTSDVTLLALQNAVIQYDLTRGFWKLIAVSNAAGPWTYDAVLRNMSSTSAGGSFTTGTDNIVSGNGAGALISSGQGNIGFGLFALAAMTTGSTNTAIGYSALPQLIDGGGNTALGSNAGSVYTGSETDNICINNDGVTGDNGVIRIGTAGTQTKLRVAGDSVGVGNSALAVDAGTYNTAVGKYSQRSTTSGSLNASFGADSLNSNTTGSTNTAVGAGAMAANTTGSGNIVVGKDAGNALTTGDNNICIGNAGVAGETGIIRIGTATTHTQANIAGTSAIVGDNTVSGTNNFVFGYNGSITGNDNTACGSSAGIVGNSCLALGNSTYAGADDAVSIGNFSQSSAAKANAIGYNAIANVESTTAVAGPFISPVSPAIAPSPSDRWRLMGDGGWICRTELLDLTATQTIEIDLPTGAYCNIDEVGIIINDPNTNSVLTPASASFGISGSNAKYLAATPMATAVAFGKRDLFTTLLADDGENTLTVEITTAATVGGGGELKGYAYWKVQVWPSET